MTLYKSLFFIAITALAVGCSPKESVDLLVVNAKVYTVDDAQKTATAFAVHQGRFVPPHASCNAPPSPQHAKDAKKHPPPRDYF